MAERLSIQFADQILCDRWQNYRPQHRCWRPGCPHSLTIPNRSEYMKLEDIERIVHFEDFEDIYHASSITQHPIQGTSHSSMPHDLYCSWFGIPSQGEHSWYGNVSCKVNFSEFLKTFKPTCYLVEIVEFRTSAQPRLLFTTMSLPFLRNVPKYNAFRYGGPWYRDRNGCDYYLSDCRRFNNEGYNGFKSVPDFVIVLRQHEYKILYELCSVGPANHSKANNNMPLACRKYPELCPTPWSVQKCNAELNKLYASQSST